MIASRTNENLQHQIYNFTSFSCNFCPTAETEVEESVLIDHFYDGIQDWISN